MTTPLLLGLAIGLGIWLFWIGLRPRPRPLPVLLAELDLPYEPLHSSPFAPGMARLVGSVSGSVSAELAQDLAVLDRTVADHTRSKLSNALILAGFATVAWIAFTTSSGKNVSPVGLGLAVAVSATLGWLITDRITRQRATQRRADTRSSLVTYLQLVAVLLAGGAGTNEALHKVIRFGNGYAFAEIDQALNEARLRGVSPWAVFANVAARKRLTDLDELAAAVELAGTSGARVRASLLTKATSMRRAQLAQLQSDAATASESMGIPIGIMLIGFVVIVGFPAFMAILQI